MSKKGWDEDCFWKSLSLIVFNSALQAQNAATQSVYAALWGVALAYSVICDYRFVKAATE
jgi:hypothetical protein